jgi:hypothetical protein
MLAWPAIRQVRLWPFWAWRFGASMAREQARGYATSPSDGGHSDADVRDPRAARQLAHASSSRSSWSASRSSSLRSPSLRVSEPRRAEGRKPGLTGWSSTAGEGQRWGVAWSFQSDDNRRKCRRGIAQQGSGAPVVHNRRGSIGLAAVVISAASLTVTACGSSAPKTPPNANIGTSASNSALSVSGQQAQSALNGLIGAKTSNGGGMTVTAVSLVPGSQAVAKGGGYTVKADVTYSDGSIFVDTVTVRADGYVSATPDSQEKNPTAAPAATDPNGQACAALDSQGYCPGDDPSPSPPAPTMTKQTDTVVFRVSGTSEPSIQYGTDSSTNNPSDDVGPLGDGNYLPWTAGVPYNAGALYYAVTAQLEGSGSIQDSVTEVVTTWCSGSKPKTESFPLANGNASGGYGIATAEYDGGDTGNASQAETDAGC